MSYYSVDIEADGPYPIDYSMVCFGAVKVTPELNTTFYGRTAPISDRWIPEALTISGFSREEHLSFPDPVEALVSFVEWVETTTKGRPIFISDNPAFDWMFMNVYMHRYAGRNPFGWSARRIGDLYCGMVNDIYAKWKWMRTTTHDHNPINDAKGNAEALLKMQEKGLKIQFK